MLTTQRPLDAIWMFETRTRWINQRSKSSVAAIDKIEATYQTYKSPFQLPANFNGRMIWKFHLYVFIGNQHLLYDRYKRRWSWRTPWRPSPRLAFPHLEPLPNTISIQCHFRTPTGKSSKYQSPLRTHVIGVHIKCFKMYMYSTSIGRGLVEQESFVLDNWWSASVSGARWPITC